MDFTSYRRSPSWIIGRFKTYSYSMGINGAVSAPQNGTPAALASTKHDKCCCGLVGIHTGAVLIALLELAFFLYQIFATSMSYDKTGDEYALAFTLTLFCFVLAIIAVALLLVGVKRKSPYFLVPHLLMQFAILTSTFLLAIYLALLLIGGTSVKVDAIFYEDSPRGELGLSQSNRYPPVKAQILARGLNTIIIALLVLTVVFFAVQMWFLVIVRASYQNLRQLAIEKPSTTTTVAALSLNGTAAPATVLNRASNGHQHQQQQQHRQYNEGLRV